MQLLRLQELSVCKQQLDSTRKQLHQAELARATTEEYAKKLERSLEKSGKGVALLKAARLQNDMGFLEKVKGITSQPLRFTGSLGFVGMYTYLWPAIHCLQENSMLFTELQQKAVDIKQLQEELQRQHDLVDEAARSVGLPSKNMLEELHELRQRVVDLSDSVLEKEEVCRRQSVELQVCVG